MILNSLARRIKGHPTINQGILLTNLFNQEVIDKIAESAWGRFGQFLQMSELLVQVESDLLY